MLGSPLSPVLEYRHSLGVGSLRSNTTVPADDGRRLGCPSGLCYKQWDVPAREVVWRQQLHDDTVSALSEHGGSQRVASGSHGGEVRLWRGSRNSDAPWELLAAHPAAGDGSPVVSACWSPDGSLLATCSQAYHRSQAGLPPPPGRLALWRVCAASHALEPLAQREGFHHHALFAGGDRVVVRSGERQCGLLLLDAETLADVAELPLAEGERVADVALNPDLLLLAVAVRGRAGSGRLLGLSAADLAPVWAFDHVAHSVGWLGPRPVSWSDGGGVVSVWGPETGAVERELPAPEGSVNYVGDWGPDGVCLARDGHVARSSSSALPSSSLELHAMCCCGLDVSPDLQRVACGDLRGNVFVWALGAPDPEPLSRTSVCGGREHASVRSLRWTRDGRELVVGSFDGRLWHWGPDFDEPPRQLLSLRATVTGLAWPHDPERALLAATTTDGALSLVSFPAAEVVARFAVSPVELWSLAWAPDDASIAVACEDQSTYVVSADDGAVLAALPGHEMAVTGVEWTAEALVTSSDDRSIRVYSSADLQLQRVLRTRFSDLMITYISLDPSGTRVAATTMGGCLYAFDLVSGEQLFRAKVHHGSAEGLEWRGPHVVTCGGDGVVNVFSAPSHL